MKNKKFIITACVILALVLSFLIVFPNIEFRKGNTLYICTYSDDFSEFEENASYNEVYFYNEKRNISLNNFECKSFLFFHLLKFNFIEGDFRETQFVLEEEYITYWLENAEITENPNNIDLSELIDGKTAVVGNTRYLGNDYKNMICYKLDGRYEELYVFYYEDLVVIQVGSPDELPKYIAYK